MPKKNINIDKFWIRELPIQFQAQKGVSIVHYINHLDQKCAFIGMHPTQTIHCETTPDTKAATSMINASLENDDCVWVAATTYEWGLNQLIPSHHSMATAVFIQYHHGLWFNFDTNSTTTLGHPTIPATLSPKITANYQASLHPHWCKKTFANAIQTAQSAIKEGDIYQINLSYPSNVHTKHSLSELYATITAQHTPPYSAYISTDACTIASFSPEEFFTIQNGSIRTRPIKGTIGKHSNPKLDLHAYQTLLNSKKDHAELVMITDLLRNDISQCATIGSVKVDELCAIRSYDYVYHLISTISAQLTPSYTALDALKMLAPGGSITGCPKISACDVIQRIENHPRNFYTGHIGFMSSSGDAAFNVAIRTCYQQNNAPILTHSGCGITIDSDPDQEYQESIDKLRFLTDYVPTH